MGFVANNPKDLNAMSLYIQSLIGLGEFDEADNFIDSLEKEFQQSDEIQSVIQRLKIAKKNLEGPTINDLEKRLNSKPNDINLICDLADKYFANNELEKGLHK